MLVKILVAAHKPYEMPGDGCYIPIEVGAALHKKKMPGFVSDDTGEEISSKNPGFCELTALYWGWKNLKADAVGLVHYRRYFGKKRKLGSTAQLQRILTEKELQDLMKSYPVLLPKPRHYVIETNYSQYVHAHHKADLQITREIIKEHCPEYLPSYDSCMQRRWGHRFNMCVMRKDLLDSYCSWLFDILFELEERLDISGYSANDQRVFGFVSERLIDCWVHKNAVPYRELPVIQMEKQNWPAKIANFLKRKFWHYRR